MYMKFGLTRALQGHVLLVDVDHASTCEYFDYHVLHWGGLGLFHTEIMREVLLISPLYEIRRVQLSLCQQLLFSYLLYSAPKAAKIYVLLLGNCI